MTTETKVEAVAWIDMAKLSDHGMVYATPFKCGDRQSPVYPASAITALEGEVERLRAELAKLHGEWQASLGWKGAVVHGTRTNIGVIADALAKESP